MLAALNSGASGRVTGSLVERKMKILDPDHIVLFGCGLNNQEQKQLMTLTQRFELNMVQSSL
jgi:hypothetical protein